MNISTFTYKDTSIDLTINNGFVAYSFLYNNDTYGIKLKLPSKKTMDVVSATALLVLNAIETYENLHSNGNGTGTTEAGQ